MIETFFFLIGIGFSILVYYRTIGPGPFTTGQKLLYAIPSFIGITGILWLFGVLLAHFLHKWHIVS